VIKMRGVMCKSPNKHISDKKKLADTRSLYERVRYKLVDKTTLYVRAILRRCLAVRLARIEMMALSSAPMSLVETSKH
jgi:hypothetical protein